MKAIGKRCSEDRERQRIAVNLPLDVDGIRARVDAVNQSSWDNERAHEYEDGLYIEVLWAIAAGVENAAELAQESLKAHDIDYIRWCA